MGFLGEKLKNKREDKFFNTVESQFSSSVIQLVDNLLIQKVTAFMLSSTIDDEEAAKRLVTEWCLQIVTVVEASFTMHTNESIDNFLKASGCQQDPNKNYYLHGYKDRIDGILDRKLRPFIQSVLNSILGTISVYYSLKIPPKDKLH